MSPLNSVQRAAIKADAELNAVGAGVGDTLRMLSDYDASEARLHEVAVACATAEQERDALAAECVELRKDRDDCLAARSHYAGRLGEALGEAYTLQAEVARLGALLTEALPGLQHLSDTAQDLETSTLVERVRAAMAQQEAGDGQP